jgi:hypothetical protein
MASGIPFSQDVFFGPNTIHAMVTAFDKACRSLHDAGQPGIAREIVAKRIIDLAREGDPSLRSDLEGAGMALGFDRSADR